MYAFIALTYIYAFDPHSSNLKFHYKENCMTYKQPFLISFDLNQGDKHDKSNKAIYNII